MSASDSGLSPSKEIALGSTQEAAADPFLGKTIAERYLVVKLLGQGGMGAVYECEHVQLKKRFAIKLLTEELKRDRLVVTRFLKEARAAAQIGHPHIIDVVDVGELPDGGAFLVMELLAGEDLEQELRRTGAMPFSRVRTVLGQVCRGLAAAHDKGIVHRDVKPANIFIARMAEGEERVKLLDFGIAQVTELAEGDSARITKTGVLMGTPAFMSPEQARGERPDHRTDIYSVGCILFNLLTGEAPFRASTLTGLITQHLFEAPPRPSQRMPTGEIPPSLDEVVVRAMAKAAGDRFQTMKELWTAIEAASDDPAAWPDPVSGRFERSPRVSQEGRAGAPTAALVPPAAASSRRRSARVLGTGLGVAAVGLAAGLMLSGRKAPPPSAAAPDPAPTAAAPPAAAVAPPAPALGEEVVLELKSVPPGAAVFVAEERLGETPIRITRARSADLLSVRLVHQGYEPQHAALPMDRDRVVELVLEPVASAARAEGAPAKVPARAPAPVPAPKKKPRALGRDGVLKDPF